MVTATSDLNVWLKSNWWTLVMLSLFAVAIAGRIRASRAEKERSHREKLSEEQREAEDRLAWARGQAKATRARFLGEILGIMFIFAICEAGLWAAGNVLPDLGESRAFMASALTLLWLIYRHLKDTADSARARAEDLEEIIREHLGTLGEQLRVLSVDSGHIRGFLERKDQGY